MILNRIPIIFNYEGANAIILGSHDNQKLSEVCRWKGAAHCDQGQAKSRLESSLYLEQKNKFRTICVVKEETRPFCPMFWMFSKKTFAFHLFLFLPIGDKKKTESKNEMRFIDRCSLGRWAQIIKQAVQNYTMFFNIYVFKALMRARGLNVSALQLRNKKAGHLPYHILAVLFC